MTSTSISLSKIEHEVMRDLVLDYIVLLTATKVSDSPTEAKLSDARYLLERLQS